jgi:hypothetical protein
MASSSSRQTSADPSPPPLTVSQKPQSHGEVRHGLFQPVPPPHGPDATPVLANTVQPDGSIPASTLPQPDEKTSQKPELGVRSMVDIKLVAAARDNNTGPSLPTFLPTVQKHLPDDFRYVLRP